MTYFLAMIHDDNPNGNGSHQHHTSEGDTFGGLGTSRAIPDPDEHVDEDSLNGPEHQEEKNGE